MSSDAERRNNDHGTSDRNSIRSKIEMYSPPTGNDRQLLFWRKLAMHSNNFLLSLSRLVQNRFYAIGSVYGITTISASVGQIKSAVRAKFTDTA